MAYGRRSRVARRTARRTFRKVRRLPKRVIAKKYANTVGQIAYRRGRKVSHGRRMRRYKKRY